MYYDLGTIIANIKAKNKDANTPKKKVTYG